MTCYSCGRPIFYAPQLAGGGSYIDLHGLEPPLVLLQCLVDPFWSLEVNTDRDWFIVKIMEF